MRIVVVGAGIAGLAAAYVLRDHDVTVVDGARQIGGKLRTSEVGGVAVDEGAEAFVLRAPEGKALAEAVGLGDRLTVPATSSASLVVRGRVRPLPSGTLLGVPTEVEPIRATFGDAAADAVAYEPSLGGEPLTGDVAVGELVRTRLGPDIADGLVDPLLGGVYAGRADQLSLRATMPAVAARLAEDPSLVRAATAAIVAAKSDEPVFGTVVDGMGALPRAVLEASGASLRLGLPVREISRHGDGFRLVAGPVPDPTVLEADGVVVAVPAAKAAPMLRDVAPWAAHELAAIDYASLAIVTLVYPSAPLPDGSGLLVPATEDRNDSLEASRPGLGTFAVKALTFSSQKWAHVGASGRTVVRASIGRYGEEQVLHRDDPDLVAAAVRDVAELTGLTAPPIASRVTRWGGGLPQYAVGHPDRVRRIRDAVARVPGLAVAGAAYDGVGIPACIRSGEAAATVVLSGLGADRGDLRESKV